MRAALVLVLVGWLTYPGSAQAETSYAAWRVDAAASTSTLSQGLKPWRDQAVILTYRPDEQLWLSAGIERSARFGKTDNVARLQVARSLPRAATVTLAVLTSPDALFRSRSAVQMSYLAPRLLPLSDGWSLGAGLEASSARYRLGQVQSVQPTVLISAPSHATISFKVIGTLDETGDATAGYAVTIDTPLKSGFSLKLGYVDAPESESGRTLKTQTVSEVLGLDVRDDLTLRVFGAQEHRSTFDRNEYGISFARRF